jgi:hypothetical protein
MACKVCDHRSRWCAHPPVGAAWSDAADPRSDKQRIRDSKNRERKLKWRRRQDIWQSAVQVIDNVRRG